MMIKRLSHSFFSTLVKIGQVVILLQNKPKFYTPLTEIEFILVLILTKSESREGGGGGKGNPKGKGRELDQKSCSHHAHKDSLSHTDPSNTLFTGNDMQDSSYCE